MASQQQEPETLVFMKPGVIVLSKDDDQEGFKWYSNGWNDGSPGAQEFMAKAHECITKGNTVPEVIQLLEQAGFEIFRSEEA